MRTAITHMPTADHEPVGEMTGTGAVIPVLYLDHAYGAVCIQFMPATPDATIAYLTALVAEASKLLDAVKAAQS